MVVQIANSIAFISSQSSKSSRTNRSPMLGAFLLVSLISSHLVLCNVPDSTISSVSESLRVEKITTLSSLLPIKSTHFKDGDNYEDDTKEVTTVMPSNNNGLSGPSNVKRDGLQDRLGDESKEKRDVDDKEEDNDEDGGEEYSTSATSTNSDVKKQSVDSGDQSKANKHQGKSGKTEDSDEEDEEEEESEHSTHSNGTSADANKTSGAGEVDEEEVATKPRMIKLDRRPSQRTREDEDHDNDASEPEDDLEEDDEEYDDTEQFANNVCTAEFFLDKIIPEDYPTEISKDVKHINETIERLNRMYNFSNQLVQKLNPFFREMASRITDFLYEAQLDSQCLGSLFRIIKGLSERKPWALSFFDATGPLFTGGYRQGKFVSLGEFDQCLETMSELPEENVNNEPIRGQFCLIKPIIPVPAEYRYIQGEPVAQSNIATVNKFLNDEYLEQYLGLYKFLKNTILRVGVCLPDKCDPVDVENALNKFLVRKTGLSVKVGPNCVKATDETPLNINQVVTLFFFGTLLLLVLSCSIYEIVYRMLLDTGRYYPSVPRSSIISTPYSFTSSQHQYPIKFLRQASTISTPYTRQPLNIQIFTMFSIIRNTRVLFEIPAYRKLPLDTMRLLLIFFFFISNAYIYTLLFAPMVIKRFYVLGPMQLASDKKYFFIRMYYLLDCFLAFSGISVALSFKPKSFSYLKFIVQNYLRYAVPILFSIGLIYIVPLFGSGPLWHLFDQTITTSCQTNLLPTLLMFSNLNESIEEICNLPTSFVALTFQMQLIAPIFLIIASHFRPKMGIIFLTLMFTIASMSNVIPRFFYGYKLPYEYQAMKSFTEIKTSVMFYNFHPLVHVSPFIFGLIAGNLINSRPIKRYWHCITIGIVSFIGFILGFIYMENLDLKAPNLSTIEIISMLTFGRIPILTFFCWIIYACLSGYIVIVKRFLSSVVWRPLAQLSYGFYITSIIVTAYRLFSIRQTTTLSAENMFRTIVSDAVVSFFLAYLIHIMVQQPMRNCRQILMHWKQLFNLDSTNLVTISKSDMVYAESTTGTFTKVVDEMGSQPERRKQSIILDLPQNMAAPTLNKNDSNNNDI